LLVIVIACNSLRSVSDQLNEDYYYYCVTRVLCIKMAKRFVKILLPTDSPIILVFVTKGRCLTLMASPVTEAPNTGGVRKLGDF